MNHDLKQLTCYCDIFGDITAHVCVTVESQAGIRAVLVLTDIEQLQKLSCVVHELSSDSPLKLGWRTGLR